MISGRGESRVLNWQFGAILAILLASAALRFLDLFTTPKGVLFDEAFNAVDAATAFAAPTPFFHDNFGREAGFIYVQSLSLRVFGYSGFALRFPAAIAGVLTVAASYSLCKQMFDRTVAVLASAWLGWSLWHVIFSRTGLRAILLPLFLVLVIFTLWRALEAATRGSAGNETYRWFALCGVLLGLAQYAYSVARFAPILVVVVIVSRALTDKGFRRRYFAGLAITALTALLVFAPLASYFLAHPDDFFERARQVSAFTQGANDTVGNALGIGLGASLGLFGVAGDRGWDRNISGFPALDPISLLLLLVGVIGCLVRWRRTSAFISLAWLFVMMAPHALTATYVPNYLRAVGILPILFVFPALGLSTLADLGSRWRSTIRVIAPLFMLAGFVGCGLLYLRVWASNPNVVATFHGDLETGYAEAYRLQASDPARRVYVGTPGADSARDPVAFFFSRMYRVTWATEPKAFVPGQSIVLPPVGTPVAYIVAAPMQFPQEIAQKYLGVTYAVSHVGTRTISLSSPDPAIEHPFDARWGDLAAMVGYNFPTRALTGASVPVVVYWQAKKFDPLPVNMFVHLLDAKRQAVAKVDDDVSLLQARARDETIVQRVALPIPEHLNPGAYWLSVGLYDQRSLQRARVMDPRGQDAGDSVVLGPLKIAKQATAPSAIAKAIAVFDNVLALDALEIGSRQVPLGGEVDATVTWQALQLLSNDYTWFMQLLDEQQHVIAQVDAQPRGGEYPTSVWDQGEIVTDRFSIAIPGAAPRGVLRLIAGFYDRLGKRMIVRDSAQGTADSIDLGNVEIQ